MSTIFSGPNPIFLGSAGPGAGFDAPAPQIKNFDVFLCEEPVVGFHVTKSPEDGDPDITGFRVLECNDE